MVEFVENRHLNINKGLEMEMEGCGTEVPEVELG